MAEEDAGAPAGGAEQWWLYRHFNSSPVQRIVDQGDPSNGIALAKVEGTGPRI